MPIPIEAMAGEIGATTASERLLKRTRSRCPVCHVPCPAEVWLAGSAPAKVFLRRSCVEHGEVSVCIASDARFYWLACGKPENAQQHYRERLADACNSSPIACDWRIYASNNEGSKFVVKAAKKFELLATNELGERITASPAAGCGSRS
jgi:hypothetical protein